MESPLLDDTVDGAVDYKGRPVCRSNSGGWRSALLIIGVEASERCAYYGISSNLIMYLTGQLGQSTAEAAENVNAWTGTALLLPLLSGFVADSFLGRYRTIVIASGLYILGLGMLTMSAVLSSYDISNCQHVEKSIWCSSTQLQVVFFFSALYVVGVAQSGHKPCVQAFGADQFDGQDPVENGAKSSFFNWWYFCYTAGTIVSINLLNYIEDDLSWALGFGIPCISMVIALVIFLLGTRTYRYCVRKDEKSSFVRIGSVFVAAVRNWRTTPETVTYEEETHGILPHQSSKQFRCLNKALISPNCSSKDTDHNVCSTSEVEEDKAVVRLVPIWSTCLVYAVVNAQSPTFFTQQGVTMDRSIASGFQVPPASLQSLVNLAILICLPIYDRVFVPLTRAFTKKPSGITMLQRIGIGLLLSAISMVVAALIEIRRLRTARDSGLIDKPNATVPMSVWWLIPQYALFGVSDVFAMVGLQEFFYDQVPGGLRSVGLGLYLSIFGVGNFLSTFLIYAIEKLTGGDGRNGWFSNNLNRAHLDYFYWLLAGLSAIELAVYVYFAKSYVYIRGNGV